MPVSYTHLCYKNQGVVRFHIVKEQMNDDAAIILIQVGCRFIGKEAVSYTHLKTGGRTQ